MKSLLLACLVSLALGNLVPHCLIQHNTNLVCYTCEVGYRLSNG
jgi:hypothetical protein